MTSPGAIVRSPQDQLEAGDGPGAQRLIARDMDPAGGCEQAKRAVVELAHTHGRI